MKLIPLTQGKFAQVDDEDFEAVNHFKWCAHKEGNTFYAVAYKNGKQIRMHRIILGLTNPNIHCDHIDRNGLCNIRSNLRSCTHSKNMLNRSACSNNSSGFKGVVWHKRDCRWQASIRASGKSIHIGLFANIKDAALAYNKAAAEHHGEFARLNEI